MKFTDEVVQRPLSDDQLEFDKDKNQPYFVFQTKDGRELVGLDEILWCVAIAEKAGEIPSPGIAFWQQCGERYGVKYPGMITLTED